jgi:hypothetical protein
VEGGRYAAPFSVQFRWLFRKYIMAVSQHLEHALAVLACMCVGVHKYIKAVHM